MTPLEYADQIRKQFEDYATDVCELTLPEEKQRYSRLGAAVIACESLIAAVTDAQAIPINEGGGTAWNACQFTQQATIIITLARECSYEMEEDGTDDPVQVAAISASMDKDGECLWTWAHDLETHMGKSFEVSFTLLGGLAITALSLTVGVP